MFKKYKVLIIILIIIAVLCICSSVSIGGTYLLFGSLFKEGDIIRNGVKKEVCESHGEFNKNDYEKWFTSEYSYEQAKSAIT